MSIVERQSDYKTSLLNIQDRRVINHRLHQGELEQKSFYA